MNTHNALTHWRLDAAGIAIIAGLSAIAYFGLISPAVASHEQAQAQADDLLQQRNKARDLDRSARATADQLAATLKAIEQSHFNLEPASALNDRLSRLTEIAGQNRLQVDTIESGATSPFPRYSTTVIRMSGRGSYRNCAAMLKQVRESTIDIGVVALQINSGGVNTDTTASFVFELLWYNQPQQKPAQK